jgi:molybdenum cofactor guanylyltransferase
MSAGAQPVPGVVGLVIAGGRSVRFGGEKAIAMLQGRELLLWAAQRLQGSCEVVAVNARPNTGAAMLAQEQGFTVLHDAPGDATGPLAGVKVGLQWAKARGARTLAVSPCDAPLLPQDLFPRLLSAASEGAAMAETSAGLEPLCAVWPVSALEAVCAALAHGAHPPTWRLLESLGARHERFEEAAAFMNVNTPADLAAVSARFAAPELAP